MFPYLQSCFFVYFLHTLNNSNVPYVSAIDENDFKFRDTEVSGLCLMSIVYTHKDDVDGGTPRLAQSKTDIFVNCYKFLCFATRQKRTISTVCFFIIAYPSVHCMHIHIPIYLLGSFGFDLKKKT